MGYGLYSLEDRTLRSATLGYTTKSADELFSKKVNSDMSPHGVSVRESRDSEEHPNSVPIIIALDVTGSMGSVPHHLLKEGLPTIMGNIIERGTKDPQVLFLAIGDHQCDRVPLQVSQFESSDELLDKWLTSTYIEGGGGGNEGESYLLAWYFAANHTSLDCFEKRGQKGILFTIGDEPTLKNVPGRVLDDLMGTGQHTNMNVSELIEDVSKLYDIYHIHVKQTKAGKKQETINGWKELLDDSVILVESYIEIPNVISEVINQRIPGYVGNEQSDTQDMML